MKRCPWRPMASFRPTLNRSNESTCGCGRTPDHDPRAHPPVDCGADRSVRAGIRGAGGVGPPAHPRPTSSRSPVNQIQGKAATQYRCVRGIKRARHTAAIRIVFHFLIPNRTVIEKPIMRTAEVKINTMNCIFFVSFNSFLVLMII